MQRLRKGIRNLIDSTSGTAVAETALVAPVLAVMIMGIVDVSNYGAAKFEVQQAINRGLEMAMIGGPTTSTESIEDQVEAQAGVPDGQVSVVQSQTCDDATTTWGTACASGEELRRFIQIDVTQTFQPTFVGGSLANFISESDGPVSISATGVLRVQ